MNNIFYCKAEFVELILYQQKPQGFKEQFKKSLSVLNLVVNEIEKPKLCYRSVCISEQIVI